MGTFALQQAWTGFSPTLGGTVANIPNTSGNLIDGNSNIEKRLSREMRRVQYRAQRALLKTLIGNAVGAGGNVVENRTRVQALQGITDSSRLGGLVTIETVPLVGATTAGRVTVTADQTQLVAMINQVTRPLPYATDLSGNGAGGNRGF